MPRQLCCIYLCPFSGPGGSQEYVFMLARKMVAHNHTVLAMPFDPPQQHFEGTFAALGGEILKLPPELCDSLDARNYLRRHEAGGELMRLIKGRGWPAPGERLVLHTGLGPLAFTSLARAAGREAVAINVFHDFGDLSGRSVSFLPNTIALSLLPRRRCAFIVPSGYVAEELAAKVAAFTRSRTHVIHTGIDLVSQRAPRAPQSPALRFGMIGRLAEAKAWDIFAAAVAAYVKGGRAGTFDWFGSGPDLAKARVRANEAGLADRLVFHGFVERTLDALDRLDVFVLSSRWEGGCLPRSVLEAMFRGVPCILPRLPSLIEAIAGRDCAILYEPGDAASIAAAFEAASGDVAALARRAEVARALVLRNHTADAEFRDTVKLYRQLL